MRLLKQLVPAVAIGIGSALMLWLIDYLADTLLHDVLWSDLPSWLDISSSSPWWIFAVLTATGMAVGLVVWLVPGHAGPNPATVDLMHPPGPLLVVPSLLLAAIFALAGGVSLGPEFPDPRRQRHPRGRSGRSAQSPRPGGELGGPGHGRHHRRPVRRADSRRAHAHRSSSLRPRARNPCGTGSLHPSAPPRRVASPTSPSTAGAACPCPCRPIPASDMATSSPPASSR